MVSIVVVLNIANSLLSSVIFKLLLDYGMVNKLC